MNFNKNNKLTLIRTSVFKGCVSLKNITIPEKVKQINQKAFQNCKSLSSAKIGKKVIIIKYNAFKDCKNLRKISFPKNIVSIEKYAFRNSGLTSITLPSKLTTIAPGTFYNCTKLKNVSMGNAITKI